MRILHILGDRKLPAKPDKQGASGFVRSVLEFARAQVKLGHSVTIAVVGAEAWISEWQGVQLQSLAVASWARLQMLGKTVDMRQHMPYVQLCQHSKFDVIHGHLYNYLRGLRSSCKVLHFQTDPFYKGSRSEGVDYKPADFQTMARYSQAQIAASKFIANELRHGFGQEADIEVVYNGVDTQQFNPIIWQSERENLRRSWSVTDKDVVFLFAGAIVPEKGVVHLARAFSQLAARRSNVHLVLAGASSLWGGQLGGNTHVDYEQQVHHMLQAETIVERVHFLGSVASSAMPATYAASDVVVIPSVWRDPFPLVALEALASARPVIASAIGGLVESVDPTNGILVRPGDEVELERAMDQFVVDSVLRKTLGATAHASVQRFSWDLAARQIDAIYQRALSRKAA